MTIARPAPRRDLIEKAAESDILDFRRQPRENDLRHDLLKCRLGCEMRWSTVTSVTRTRRGVAICQEFLHEPALPFEFQPRRWQKDGAQRWILSCTYTSN